MRRFELLEPRSMQAAWEILAHHEDSRPTLNLPPGLQRIGGVA